jgi:hypothetical protein
LYLDIFFQIYGSYPSRSVKIPCIPISGGSGLGGLGGFGGGYGEDPYLHINKRELVGGALLLGAGIIKGVIATSVFNSLSPNVQVPIL